MFDTTFRNLMFCLTNQKKALAGLLEVSSGFEPEYTVLQTGA